MNQNTELFIQENAFESAVPNVSAILSRPQCINISMFWLKQEPWMYFAEHFR